METYFRFTSKHLKSTYFLGIFIAALIGLSACSQQPHTHAQPEHISDSKTLLLQRYTDVENQIQDILKAYPSSDSSKNEVSIADSKPTAQSDDSVAVYAENVRRDVLSLELKARKAFRSRNVDFTAAQSFLSTVSDFFVSLNEVVPDSPTYLTDLYSSYSKLSTIAHINKDYSNSREAAQSGLDTATALSALDNTNPKYKTFQASQHAKLASIARQLGELDTAREHHQTEIHIATEVVKTTPDLKAVRTLSMARKNAGTFESKYGEVDIANDHLLKGLDLAMSLEQSGDKEAMVSQRRIADFHFQLGHNNLAHGNLSAAQEHLEQSTKIYETLMTSDKKSSSLPYRVASSHTKLGSALRRQAVYGLSKLSYNKGLKIYEDLLAEEPSSPSIQIAVANSHFQLGKTSWGEDDFASSKAHFNHSLDIHRELIDSNSENRWSVQWLPLNLMWVAHNELELGNTESAKNLFDSALSKSQTLLNQHESPRKHKDVVLIHEGLGDYHVKQSDMASAKKHYELALTRIEELKESGTIPQDGWQPILTRIENSMQDLNNEGSV